jgi:hypothetical protein
MKKIVLLPAIAVALLLAGTTKAQEVSGLDKDITEKEVPAAVMKTFKEKYPKQKVDKWELKGGNYEADFTQNAKFCELAMKADGTWIEFEIKIEKTEVPKAVLDAHMKSKYKDWTYDHAEEVKTPKHDKLYEVTVKKGKEMMGLYFTPDGKTLVREEKD